MTQTKVGKLVTTPGTLRGQPQSGVLQNLEHGIEYRDKNGHASQPMAPNTMEVHNANLHHTQAVTEKTGTTVFIDNNPYHVASTHVTETELRNLTTPPIAKEKSLYRVVSGHGKGQDILMQNDESVEVNKNKPELGRHFYSAKPPTHDQVATRAYYLYQQTGNKPGHCTENWTKAESQIKGELRP